MHQGNAERSAANCFSDLPKEEGLHWYAKFSLHSAASFANPLTHPGYKDVPVSYLICEDDLVIPAEIQRREIEMIEKESGSKVDVTSIRAGHCPTISVPEQVVEWLLEEAKKV
jgi:pimeloyl-ACP methyl ester carboxylesterase